MNELKCILNGILHVISHVLKYFANAFINFPSFSKCVFVHAFVHMYQMKAVQSSANRAARQSEGVWYKAVKLTDNFVNSFLPAGVVVSSGPNG